MDTLPTLIPWADDLVREYLLAQLASFFPNLSCSAQATGFNPCEMPKCRPSKQQRRSFVPSTTPQPEFSQRLRYRHQTLSRAKSDIHRRHHLFQLAPIEDELLNGLMASVHKAP